MSYKQAIYGGIHANDVNLEHTISGTGIANKVQITAFNANDPSNGTTPNNTTDDITILYAGDYHITVSATLESVSGSSAEFGYAVFINNGATEVLNMHGHRDIASGGGQAGSISMAGVATFAVNDTVEVWVWNETNTQNIVVDDISLSLHRIN